LVAGVAAPNSTADSAHHAHPFRCVACRLVSTTR
jgi:hypothetical protein